MGSVPPGLRWLSFHSPGLHLSLAVGYPGNGYDFGLCDLRPCAAHTHSSWGHKALVAVGSGQRVPVPITGSEAGLRAMDEVPDKLVLIFQEPAENWLIYLQ